MVSPTSPLSVDTVQEVRTVSEALRDEPRRRAGGNPTRPPSGGVRAGANTMPVPMSVASGVADVEVDVGRGGHARRKGAAGGRQVNGLFGELDSSHGGDRERGARRCWRGRRGKWSLLSAGCPGYAIPVLSRCRALAAFERLRTSKNANICQRLNSQFYRCTYYISSYCSTLQVPGA